MRAVELIVTQMSIKINMISANSVPTAEIVITAAPALLLKVGRGDLSIANGMRLCQTWPSEMEPAVESRTQASGE